MLLRLLLFVVVCVVVVVADVAVAAAAAAGVVVVVVEPHVVYSGHCFGEQLASPSMTPTTCGSVGSNCL